MKNGAKTQNQLVNELVDRADNFYFRRLRRLKWSILCLTAFLLAVVEAYYYFIRGVPFIEDVVDYLIGMVIAVVLIEICFRVVANLQRRLQREIAEHKESEEKLRINEKRLRSLFETMVEGLVLIAPDGQIVQANPAAERILGLTSTTDLRGSSAPS